MSLATLRIPAWSCLLILAAGPAPGREVPFVRQPSVDPSFPGVAALAAGDLDGDGLVDLVGASESGGELGWWQGDDPFSPGFLPFAVIDAAFGGAKAVALGDVDGDGDLDLVAAATTGMELAWWANDGAGIVWTKDVISSPGTEVRGVALADVDRNGTLDVVAAGGDAVRWFSNDAGDGSAWSGAAVAGAGTFAGARAVAVGDLDDDGDLDVAAVAATAGAVAWFENAGAGATWTRHDLDTTFPDANAVAVADLDGDGSLDVVAVNDSPPDGEIAWWEVPAGTAHFVGEVVGSASLAVADVDGDGDMDVAAGGAVTAPGADVVWLENSAGDGSAFTPRAVDASFHQAVALIAEDLDRDGDLDLAGGSLTSSTVLWWTNETVHRSALFRARVPVTSFVGPATGLVAGDLDDDGDLDLVTGHLGGGGAQARALWLENIGGAFGGFVEHDIDTSFGAAGGWALGDVDGDGDLDVIAGYGGVVQGKVSWYENDGTPADAEWTEHVIDGQTVVLGSPRSVAVADLDRNGTLDVVAALQTDDAVVWYRNDSGDGSAWTRTDVDAAFDAPGALRVVDLDGDGRLDVLAISDSPSQASWWADTSVAGDGSTWTEQALGSVSAPTSLAVGDRDGDGDLDVLFGRSNAAVSECRNGGDAVTWTCTSLDFVGLGTARELEAVDLDGDGDLDVPTLIDATDGRLRWIDNRPDPAADPRIDIDRTFADGQGLAVADLDGDGDLDLAAVSNCSTGSCSPIKELAVWENAGGQFSLATTDTAPPVIPSGRADEVLRIDARHLGRDGYSRHPLDLDIELTSFELLFEESGGDPLTGAEMGALIDRLEIWVDAEEAGTQAAFDTEDELVTAVAAPFAVSAGRLTVPFVAGDSNVLLQPDQTNTSTVVENVRTYFVVVVLTANAVSQTPTSFQLTHLTESGSAAQDALAWLPLEIEWAANVATEGITAGPAAPPDHLLIQRETFGGVDTREACLTITADTEVVIQAGATVVFRAGGRVTVGDGFQVEAGSSFRVETTAPALCP